MPTKRDPVNQSINTITELQLQQESQKLQRTNELLEKQIKARTTDLKRTNKQLEKEIQERIQSAERLKNRVAFDRVLTSISTKFINLTVAEIDEEITNALEKIATFTQFDRSYIYLFEGNGRSLINTHQWCGPDAKTTLNDFQTLPADLFQQWIPQLLEKKSIQLQNIADQPDNDSSEEQLLVLQGVRSALIMPLVYSKETIGFLGLDVCAATLPAQAENIDPLKVVGNVFVNAMMRQKNEERLTNERNFAEQIMTTMGQGLMMVDVEGNVEYVNPAYANLLGCQAEAVIGKTLLDLTYAKDHPKLIQAHMSHLEGTPSSYETQLIKLDGSSVYVLVSGVPHFDHQGKIIGSIATITDLTDRHRIETKIQANAEEIKAIYEASIQLFKPDNVQELAEQIVSIAIDRLGFDACGVLLLQEPINLHLNGANQAIDEASNYLTWLARYEQYRKQTTSAIPLHENSLIATAVRQGEIIYAPDVSLDPRYLPDNTNTQSELVIPLQTYNHIIGAIDLQSNQKDGFDERSQRIITIFAEHASLALETVRLYDELRDHTAQLQTQISKRRKAEENLYKQSHELKQINAQLARALRTKDEFLANMSHELRTPLNAILGKTEILAEGIHGPVTEKQAASLKVIGESGRHLLQLINDILDLAKIEAGKIQLDIQPISLDQISERSLQFVRQMAHKKRVKLQSTLDPSLKTLHADERRVMQILINLLSNAVKFTPSGGEVGLNIMEDTENKAVQFQVWDTGIGISDENMSRLFKPFAQLDSSLARLHEGTGLGLSLVYRLSKIHCGSVSLESQIGVGSCFTVSLPQKPCFDSDKLIAQAKTDRVKYGDVLASSLEDSSAPKPLILLVDDNETDIETLSDYLSAWGYRLANARSDSEVLQQILTEKPNLILMDIQLPKMDGLATIRQLCQNDACKHIPIVALTALAISGDKERCLAAGASEYVNKPIQLHRLALILDRLLTEADLKNGEMQDV